MLKSRVLAGIFVAVLAFIDSSYAQASGQTTWNLNGTWEIEGTRVEWDNSSGRCSGTSIPYNGKHTISQNGSQIRVSGFLPGNGRVSGNQFQYTVQERPIREWSGTISQQVDIERMRIITRVNGSTVCEGQAKRSLILTREEKPVYNYIYINGINTPRGNSNDFRGSCLSERRMVQQVLIDRTRLKDETNKLLETDCNLSGFDGTEALRKITTWNAQGVPLSVSDLVQSFLQTQGSRNPRVESDRLSGKIVSQMREIMKKENDSQSNEQNYFIIVAHSQGNFFAEKIGGELASSNSEIDQKLVKRLRIMAIASPTDYTYSLNTNSGSTRVKVQHFTRCDDIVLFLPLLKIPIPGIQSARPFPGNLRPPLRRDGQCVVPNLLTSNDPLLGDNVRAHFLDEYFNSLPIVQVITDRLVAEKKNLLYED